MLKKILRLITLSVTFVGLPVIASSFSEEQELHMQNITAHQERHQTALSAARSGNVDELKSLLLPQDGNPAKHTPTEYDTRELFNAAFINKQLPVIECFWKIPGFPDPVDYLYLDMSIDHPYTTIPYPQPEVSSIDRLNDIFSYNICSQTAFCHIDTLTPNTEELTNNRWQFIFDFFKAAEDANQSKLVGFIIWKAGSYNMDHRSQEFYKWSAFIVEKLLEKNIKIKNPLTIRL